MNESNCMRSNRDWQRIFNATAIPIMILDSDYRILNINTEMVSLLGVTATEALGRCCYELVHHSDTPPASCPYARMLRDHQPGSVEICGAGLGKQLQITLTPLFDEHGELQGAIHHAHDITERKQVENSLWESRQLLLHMIDFLPEATFVVDNDRKVLAWNRAMEELSGMEKEKVIGSTEYAYSVPLLGKGRKCLLEHLDTELELHHSNFSYVRRNGDNLHAELFSETFYNGRGGYVLITAAPLLDDSGRRLGAIETIRDITAIKRTKNDLQKKSIELDMFFNNSLDLLCVADTKGFFRRLNPEWEAVLGYPLATLEGAYFIDYLHPEDVSAASEALVALNEQHKVKDLVMRFRCQSGEFRSIEWHCYPLGKIIYVTARDISERLTHEEALQEAMKVADAANKAKGDFLALISHEIRTPMNSIIGMSDLLVKQHLGQAQRNYAERIHSSAINLLDIINDVLDISKIESGIVTVESEPFDLRQICDDVMSMFLAKASDRHIELILRCPLHIPTNLIGDATRIRQVLTNLVGNAVKFTEHGYIMVDVTCEQIGNSESTLKIRVVDTGKGIPPEKMPLLFKRFSQVDISSSRNSGGSGLGLAICKELVELMGGAIGVESRPGTGSRFWFTLSLPFDPAHDGETEQQPLLRHKRILIVDDIQPNRAVLADYCAALGGRCEEASSPVIALDLIRSASENGTPYQLVFIDRHMPELDGITLGRKIRAEEHLKDTCLVLLSSESGLGREAEVEDGIFQATITKPVHFHLFLQGIRTVWPPADTKEGALAKVNGKQEDPEMAGEQEHSRELRVLVVEDNLSNQMVAVAMLQYFGCHADVASNGREAVEKVKHNSYEIIFMDCLMPLMNGFEATEVIRRMDGLKGKSIIIALTANVLKGYRKKCLTAGMNDYLSKPLQSHELKKILDRWTNPLWHVTDKAENDVNGFSLEDNFEAVFSTERLKELLLMFNKTGKDFYPTVVAPFLQHIEESVETFDAAIKERRFVELFETAHRLKGGSSNLGLWKISSICAELMEYAQKKSIENFTELVPALESQALLVSQFEGKLKAHELNLFNLRAAEVQGSGHLQGSA
jgi:PAS domain S-box-containing protein